MERRFVSIVSVVAALFPASAFAACVQADLTGSWRFQFNVGTATANGRTMMMDCVLGIDATGAISPKTCLTLYGTTDEGSIVINSPQRKLKVNSSCAVHLSGASQFTNDIVLQLADGPNLTRSFFVNKVTLTLSKSKDMMLGNFSVDTGDVLGNAAVIAVKR